MGEEGLEPPRSHDDGFTVRWANQLLNSPFCTLYRDRTCDLLYVKQPLLPSELRVLIVSPTGFEPVTPPLKAECSETNWATRTLSKWQGSNLRPDGPKPPALPSELHLVVEERAGFEPADPWRSPVFKTGAINQLYHLSLLLSPKGSNLNSMDQNHVSCQLDEGTIMKPICQRTFWGLYQVRTDDSGLQSRDITNYTKRPI